MKTWFLKYQVRDKTVCYGLFLQVLLHTFHEIKTFSAIKGMGINESKRTQGILVALLQ